MLSQCVSFGINSGGFFKRWRNQEPPFSGLSVGASPTSVSQCDSQEVYDMINWQAFVATIPVVEVEDGLRVPDITATQVPLSVVLSAHHNLVTYGVPFMNTGGKWTNPGPQKTYYSPEEAIRTLAPAVDEISRDTVARDWLTKIRPTLDVDNLPGMAKCVAAAKNKWALPHKEEDAWTRWHERSDSWQPGQTLRRAS